MEVFVRHPLQALALIVGGGAMAAAAGMVRHGYYAVALSFGALGILILLGAGRMMLRTPDWGTAEDWGPVATDARQRMNLLLIAVGMLVVGVGAMWLGFGPGSLVAQLLLIGGGFLLLLLGFIVLTMWLQARRLFSP